MTERHETDEGHEAGERRDRPVSREELVSTVAFALRKAQRLWPKRRVPGVHDEFTPMAGAIVDHMELCKLRCVGKRPEPPPVATALLTEERRAAAEARQKKRR